MKWLNVLDGDNLQHLTSNTLVQTFLFFFQTSFTFTININNQPRAFQAWAQQSNLFSHFMAPPEKYQTSFFQHRREDVKVNDVSYMDITPVFFSIFKMGTKKSEVVNILLERIGLTILKLRKSIYHRYLGLITQSTLFHYFLKLELQAFLTNFPCKIPNGLK